MTLLSPVAMRSSNDSNYKSEKVLTKSMTNYRWLLHYYVRMEVWYKLERIFLSHTKYANEVIKKFMVMDYKAFNKPIYHGMKLTKDEVEKPISATSGHV